MIGVPLEYLLERLPTYLWSTIMKSSTERETMTLVVFDFDGTLSASDMTVLLGNEKGVGNEISGLVDQGRRGDVGFEESLRQRVSMLEGLPERDVEAAFDRIKFRSGVGDLVAALKRSDVQVAIVTGSFERGVERALDQANIGVDEIVANRLVFDRGALTGEIEGPLLGGDKGNALEELALDRGLDLDNTVAVGDGATDLPMLKIAGTAIGFSPDPIVEQYCDVVVNSIDRLHLYLEQRGIIDQLD